METCCAVYFSLEIVLSCLPRDLPLLAADLVTCPQVTQKTASCLHMQQWGEGFYKTTFGTGEKKAFKCLHVTVQTQVLITWLEQRQILAHHLGTPVGWALFLAWIYLLVFGELGCDWAMVSSQTSSQVVQSWSPPSCLTRRCSQPQPPQ